MMSSRPVRTRSWSRIGKCGVRPEAPPDPFPAHNPHVHTRDHLIFVIRVNLWLHLPWFGCRPRPSSLPGPPDHHPVTLDLRHPNGCILLDEVALCGHTQPTIAEDARPPRPEGRERNALLTNEAIIAT